MEVYSWHREPVGDYIASFTTDAFTSSNLKGHALALEKLHTTFRLLESDDTENSFKKGLSRSQLVSLAILQEWWEGKVQDARLSDAARQAITAAASEQGAKGNSLDVYNSMARLQESRYHKNMFLLFQLEYVHETTLLQVSNFIVFLGFIQAQRERCAQTSAMQ